MQVQILSGAPESKGLGKSRVFFFDCYLKDLPVEE
jgi:hypothetical protein